MELISNGYANLKILAMGTFPGVVTRITNVVPIEYSKRGNAAAVAFDYLPAVANHIYFLGSIAAWESSNITGNPVVNKYDIAGVASNMFVLNLAVTDDFVGNVKIWASRLEHTPNGASAGTYWLSLLGYDITYI